MPSGRTHDGITFLLAFPALAAAYLVTTSVSASVIVGSSFVFGGLMFGPDLDTVSRQYSRWFFLRFLWYPYRSFFKHRSRFSHGLIFGALIRVIYFMGVMTLIAYLTIIVWMKISDSAMLAVSDIPNAWRATGHLVRTHLGDQFFLLSFVGLWSGAASHTFTDMAGSFVKTGRIAKFL